MFARQREQDADSTELLLDTICNVFGGIILMAILVILQTQMTARQIPDLTPEAMELNLAEQRLRDHRAALREQLADAGNNAALLAETYQANTSPNTDLLLGRREVFSRAVRDAQRRLAELAADKTASEQRRSQLAATLLDLAERVRSEQAKKLAVEDRMRTAKQTVSRKVRLPRRHVQRAPRQASYMVVGREFFPLEPAYVTSQSVFEGKGTLYTPRANRGLAVLGPGGQAPTFLGQIARLSPRSHFISFWVRADSRSFESFQALRAVAARGGFEYSVSHHLADPGLILGPGKPPVE